MWCLWLQQDSVPAQNATSATAHEPSATACGQPSPAARGILKAAHGLKQTVVLTALLDQHVNNMTDVFVRNSVLSQIAIKDENQPAFDDVLQQKVSLKAAQWAGGLFYCMCSYERIYI